MCSQGSVNDTSHLSTPDDDVHIGIHRTLVVSGKNDTGIIVVGSFNTINDSLLVVGIVPFSVDIHGDGTLDRLGWSSHHTIQLFSLVVFCDSLTSTYADGRIESRLDGDGETLFAMRHGTVEGSDAVFIFQRIEAAIVTETTEYLHRSGYGTIDGTIVGRVLVESRHLDAFAHLQVVILAEDVLVGIITCSFIVEGNMLKAGIFPDRQTHIKTCNFDTGIFIFSLIILTSNGNVFEKWRFFRLAPHFSGKDLLTDVIWGDVEAVCLVVGDRRITLSHQHDDVLVP